MRMSTSKKRLVASVVVTYKRREEVSIRNENENEL